jgi:hypothetical protein
MKTKQVVRPSKIQRTVLNLDFAGVGAGKLDVDILFLSQG